MRRTARPSIVLGLQTSQSPTDATTSVVMPQMGESIAEGTIVRWMKKVGDPVDRDEPLFEISTDKVDAEIPVAGGRRAAEITASEGETVPVDSVVGDDRRARARTIGRSAAAPAAATARPLAASRRPTAARADGAADRTPRTPAARRSRRPPAGAAPPVERRRRRGRRAAEVLAARAAHRAEHNVDIGADRRAPARRPRHQARHPRSSTSALAAGRAAAAVPRRRASRVPPSSPASRVESSRCR